MNRSDCRLRILVSCLAIALPMSASLAADEASPLNLVPRDAAAFVHIRVADIWKHDAFKSVRDAITNKEPKILKEIERTSGIHPANVESVTFIFPEFGDSRTPLALVRTLQPYDKVKLLTALQIIIGPAQVRDNPFDGGERESSRPFQPNMSARHYQLTEEGAHLFIVDNRTVLFGFTNRFGDNDSLLAYSVRMLKRAEKGPLDGALDEARKKHTIVVGIDVVELAKSLPKKLQPGLKELLAAKSTILTFDLKDEFSLALNVEAADAAAAKQVEDGLHAFIGLVKEALPGWRRDAKNISETPIVNLRIVNLLLDQAEKGLMKAAVESQGSRVYLTTSVKPDGVFQAVLQIAAQLTSTRERRVSVNNLKQIGLAAQNFHDTYNFLPFPGFTQTKEKVVKVILKPNFSWRVGILPFIEELNLYNEFHFDEPWDSDHNKKLIPKMPRTFAPPPGINALKGHTFYRTFSGPGTISAAPLTLVGITDGTSNTLMVVEAAEAVPWTKPDELPYDPKKPLPKLGGLYNGNFNALFADGSVRYIRKEIPEKMMRALITINGGEVVDWSWDKEK